VKAIESAVESDGEFYKEVLGSDILRELLFPTLYTDEVSSAAHEFNIEPSLLFAIIRQESRFNQRAVSPSNAIGLMQIIPSSGEWIAEKMGMRGFKPTSLYEARLNIRMGTWYLRYLTDKYGDMPTALAAYNWGPGSMSRWKEKFTPADIDWFFESIPKAETRRYVKNILLNYQVYKKVHGE